MARAHSFFRLAGVCSWTTHSLSQEVCTERKSHWTTVCLRVTLNKRVALDWVAVALNDSPNENRMEQKSCWLRIWRGVMLNENVNESHFERDSDQESHWTRFGLKNQSRMRVVLNESLNEIRAEERESEWELRWTKILLNENLHESHSELESDRELCWVRIWLRVALKKSNASE